jgi:hypothetical protein
VQAKSSLVILPLLTTWLDYNTRHQSYNKYG